MIYGYNGFAIQFYCFEAFYASINPTELSLQ